MTTKENREFRISNRTMCTLLLVIGGCVVLVNSTVLRRDVEPQVVNNNSIEPQEMSPFNATAFWNVEKVRVTGTALNITISNKSTITYNGATYNKTELSYEIPNWVGASPLTLTINATLFTPTNASGHLGLMPGIAVFHGLGGNRRDMYNYALSIVSMNCCAIVPDLPGHGASEGPLPTPQKILFQGDFNKTSHQYLAFCDGIQAIRVLYSLATTVDTSRIAITGMSYGGWTSLCVGAILHDKIDLVIPNCAVGDFSTILPTSLWYDVTNSTVDQTRAWLSAKGAIVDPVNYIGISNYPDVCWRVGTTDDFFNYQSIDVTYNAATGAGNKWLIIEPNGHHMMFPDVSPQFLIKYKFLGGPAPPSISGLPGQRFIDGVVDGVHVQVIIASTAAIQEVDMCYKYASLTGDPWHVAAMSESSPGSGSWSGTIDAPWIGSSVDYYVIVKVVNPDGATMFTSPIYNAGYLNNYIVFLPIGGIVAGIVLLAIIMLRYRYTFEVRGVEKFLRKKARLHFLLENAFLGVTEGMIFGSLSLPWVNVSRTLSWTQIDIMNDLFTWTAVLGNFAYSITVILFTSFSICALLSLLNPLLSGLLNMVWPAFFIVVLQLVAKILTGIASLPASMYGIGIFVFLFGGMGQVAIWTWKQVYQKRMAIHRHNIITFFKELATKRSGKV